MTYVTGVNVTLFIFAALTFSISHADTSLLPDKKIKQPVNINSIQLNKKSNKSENLFGLSLKSSSFFMSETEFFKSRGANKSLSEVKLSYKLDKNSQLSKSYIDIEGLYSFDEKFAYPNIKEFYHQIKLKNSDIILGRKITNWFQQEVVWDQGLWQPRFAQDRLNTETQGLFAAFYTLKSKNWKFTGFYSPLFIPEISPGFKNENGTFISTNPWFRAPLSTIYFEGAEEPTNINYQLTNINIFNDILNHPGIGLHAQYKRKQYTTNIGYSYKPMNQILLEFPFEYQIGVTEEQVNVIIHPKVSYHHLLTVETAYKDNHWLNRFSLTAESPEPNTTPDNWVSQGSKEALIASLYFGYNMNGLSHDTHLYTSAVKVWGGDSNDIGPSVILKDNSYFDRRYQYTEAIMVGLKKPKAHLFSRPTQLESKIIYDVPQNAAIFSTSLTSELTQQLSLSVQLDILGLISENTPEIEDGFIRNFRANDRLQGELTYVF